MRTVEEDVSTALGRLQNNLVAAQTAKAMVKETSTRQEEFGKVLGKLAGKVDSIIAKQTADGLSGETRYISHQAFSGKALEFGALLI